MKPDSDEFQGRDKYKILDRKEFDGDLYSNYQDTVTYLQSKLNTEYIWWKKSVPA